MASVRNANSFYVDSTDSLEVLGLSVYTITLTSTSGAGVITLQDNTDTPTTKLTLKVPNGETLLFDFNLMPLLFPNGIVVSVLTNAVATIVFKEGNR